MAANQAQGRLKSASQGLLEAVGNKAVGAVGNRVTSLTDRLEEVASGSPAKAAVDAGKSVAKGDSPAKGALKGVASSVKDKIPGLGGGGSGSGGAAKPTKATNIIEDIDVGVPIREAYDQWTEFGGFPSFMKKVENVEAEEDNKLEWKAKIVWSHRTWKATVLEQVPDERIVWRSKGEKGHVDGAVTFHELGPNLTRILLVLEYYPQGLFERTGNIWRAQGRRARVELKHFRRHVMTRTILDPDELEGWRGTIEDGEVVQSHEDAIEEEQQDQDEGQDESGDDTSADEPEDEYEDEESEDSDEPEDEYEDEPEDEESDEESDETEDEYDEGEESDEETEDEYEDEGEEPEDEYDEDQDTEGDEESEESEESDEPPARSRRRRAS